MKHLYQFAVVCFGLLFFAGAYAGAAPVRARLITSPSVLPEASVRRSVFLAGSIEMGKAADWQADLTKALQDLDIDILNPRRPDWNRAWKPELTDPHFRQQVEWELRALESAEVIIMFLAPDTQSPISLLELGLYARAGKLIVYCPSGFWRKGNVDAVAARYGIEQVGSLEELAAAARRRFTEPPSSRP